MAQERKLKHISLARRFATFSVVPFFWSSHSTKIPGTRNRCLCGLHHDASLTSPDRYPTLFTKSLILTMKFTSALVAAATISSVYGWQIQWEGGSASGDRRQGCTNVGRDHGSYLSWSGYSYGPGGALPPPTPYGPGGALPPPTPYGAPAPAPYGAPAPVPAGPFGGSAFAQAQAAPIPPPAGAFPPGPPPPGPAYPDRVCRLEIFPRRDCEGPRQEFQQDFSGRINFSWRSYKVRCERA